MTTWPRSVGWGHVGVARAHPFTPRQRAGTVGATTRILSSLAVAGASFLLYSNLPVVLSRHGLPTAVAVLVPALLMFAALHRIMVCRERIVIDRTFLMMLGLLAVFLFSAFAARGLDQAVSRISVYAIEGVLMYFLVRNAIGSVAELRWAAVGVVCAAVLVSVLALVQALTGNYEQDFLGLAERNLERVEAPASGSAPGEPQMRLEDRAYGPVGEPNRFAQILLMALPVALVLAQTARSRLGTFLGFGSVLAVFGGVLVTYSRGAFLTMAVLAVLMVPMRLMSARKLIGLTALALLLTPIVAPAYAQRMISIGGVAELFGSTEAEADGATEGRTTEMLAALAAYTDHPVLGVGPGQYLHFYSVYYQALPEISIREIAEPRRAHSLYLELGAELGTIGLFVFLAIPLLLLRDLRVLRLGLAERRPDLARLAACFSLVLLAYLGTGVFLHLAFERYYWFMVGMTAAAAGVLHKLSRTSRFDDSDTWVIRPSSI